MILEKENIIFLHETKTGLIYLREDGIFQLLIKPNSHIQLADSLEIFEVLKKYSNAVENILLLTVIGEHCTWDKEAREFTSTSEYSTLIKGEAVVVNSLAHKLLFNFTLKTFRPQFKMSVFSEENIAVNWLKRFNTILINPQVCLDFVKYEHITKINSQVSLN